MAFQPAPDVAEAVINYVALGQPMVNRLNFEKVGGYNQSDIDNLAAVIDLAVSDYILPLIQPNITYLFTKARGLSSPIDLEATNATNTGNGITSGTNLSLQTSYVVKLGTGATGRSARGRIYMPPMGEVNTTNSRTVSSSYSDNAVDAIADMLTDALVAGWTGVILSRQQGGVIPAVATARAITDIIASNRNIDTQRRRVGK